LVCEDLKLGIKKNKDKIEKMGSSGGTLGRA
jgi:hypothetical protein